MSDQEPSQKQKNERKVVRARASRLLKRAAKKLAEIPDEFLDRALRRFGEQLDAVKLIWDVNAKEMVEIPDEKIRQDAAIMILAYKWGKPVERSVTATGSPDDFAEMLGRFRQIESGDSSQKTVQGKELPPALPDAGREEGGHAS